MNKSVPQPSECFTPMGECQEHCVDLTVGDAIARAGQKWGDRDAVVYRHQPLIDDVVWTYKDLDATAERLAAVLLELGYKPGEKVAVWSPNHPDWILLEYAIAKAGLVIVALNPLYRPRELKFALQDSGAAGIFYADRIGAHAPAEAIAKVREEAPSLRYAHSFSSIRADLLKREVGGMPKISIDPGQTFMIQYTSGTTGVPKAVRLSHKAITITARNSYSQWRLNENSRVCFGFPLFHVGGSGNSVPGACLNGATALPLYIFKPAVTLDILEHEHCTAFIGVPTMLLTMLDDPTIAGRDFSAMKSIIVGGAPVSHDLLHRCQDIFNAEVINCYGQTETCGVTTTTLYSDREEKKVETSGRPLVGVGVSIRDEEGQVVPRGELGQLFYRGPGRMTGYGSADTPVAEGDAWIASGDLARMDEDDFVSITGRKKEMIIRGGENLSPVEIEHYMKEHAAIADVAVIGVPDEKYGEVACAVVRLRPEAELSSEDILQWCAERISRWKVPEYVEFVDEFPMTPSGKIQKFILQKIMSERLGVADRQRQESQRQNKGNKS
ncbi:class I adenylate-forming enzyme family protein [Emcibacter sp.]|uniref:class I adenylate-forming enzyme family protein n=1 Tax=Emcibacter sp. TaxID=1979954 RepID=UPI002AA62DAF|nr:AMP-binding protein [Emcibacter sp.]